MSRKVNIILSDGDYQALVDASLADPARWPSLSAYLRDALQTGHKVLAAVNREHETGAPQ